MPGFIIYTTKAAGWIAFGLFPLHAMVAGRYSEILFWALWAATLLKSFEETRICLWVSDPYAKVRPSLLAYLRTEQSAAARVT